VNLKKSNDLMEVFDQALSKTNTLMETMDNFNPYRKLESTNDNYESNKNDNNNYNIRKKTKSKTNMQKKADKAQLKPITKPQYPYIYKRREPFNFQKEYENDLINQIEKLFNPSYQKNGKKEEIGFLSFLSPLINSNIDEKNKNFYKKNLNINKAKINNELKKVNDNSNNEKNNESPPNELNNNSSSRRLSRKYSFNDKKLKSIRKKSLSQKKTENNLEKQISQKSFAEKNKKGKYDIPEINELKRNRYFTRTKTSFRNSIVARDVSSKSKKKQQSNVEQLINRLKKHYS
jgi:hypothetical protein